MTEKQKGHSLERPRWLNLNQIRNDCSIPAARMYKDNNTCVYNKRWPGWK